MEWHTCLRNLQNFLNCLDVGGLTKKTTSTVLQWILCLFLFLFVCLFIFCQNFVIVSSVYYRADCGEGEEMCWFSLLGLPPPALATDTGINHVICTQALQHTLFTTFTQNKRRIQRWIYLHSSRTQIYQREFPTCIDDMLHVYWKLKQVSLCLINFFHSVAVAMSAPQCQCQPQHWRQRNFAFTCYLKFFFPLS